MQITPLSPNIAVAQYSPQFLNPQKIGTNGDRATVSETILGPSANALTSSDQALISAATGAQFNATSQGLQMIQYYQAGVPINGQDFSAALAKVQQDMIKNGQASVPTEVTNALASAGAEFGYVQNFTNAMISVRQSIGPDQSITPSMIIAAVKQSNANNETIPQDYVASAIGYLNGIG
jgi:hypothetical protein